ncbi:MAG TPA: CxxC-x17-CxxC domain-containing protein [Candidatus Bathyarchaeia archaeon]|nr:CxxC-x17-CxxC domain-containing protein [Candidatus Bathyarchaeia archaeon]
MSQKTMYEVKCTSCGQAATVPFKPSPDKPVYCRACFAKRSTNPPTAGTNSSYNFEPKQAWARRRK